jgi:hypothetical protein
VDVAGVALQCICECCSSLRVAGCVEQQHCGDSQCCRRYWLTDCLAAAVGWTGRQGNSCIASSQELALGWCVRVRVHVVTSVAV